MVEITLALPIDASKITVTFVSEGADDADLADATVTIKATVDKNDSNKIKLTFQSDTAVKANSGDNNGAGANKTLGSIVIKFAEYDFDITIDDCIVVAGGAQTT